MLHAAQGGKFGRQVLELAAMMRSKSQVPELSGKVMIRATTDIQMPKAAPAAEAVGQGLELATRIRVSVEKTTQAATAVRQNLSTCSMD